MPEDPAPESLLLVDGNALIHRAFHAFPNLTHENRPINAVYGFARMLLGALQELRPDYAVVAFDVSKKTFRHKKFPQYKAQRIAAPQALYDQIPEIQALIKACNLPAVGVEGFEADDVIATFAAQARALHLNVKIVSSDKDTFQLVNNTTAVFVPLRARGGLEKVGPRQVQERLGVPPEKVAAWKSLAGDPSDNIPGVAGIGDKTARALLQHFPSLEALLVGAQKRDSQIPLKLQVRLTSSAQTALQALELVRLHTDLPIQLDLSAAKTAGLFQRADLRDFFAKRNFQSLLKFLSLPQEPLQKTQASLFI